MPSGLQYSNVIDAVGISKKGICTLFMVEERPWDGTESRLLELQAKVNNYLEYVAGGHLTSEHPATLGKPVEILLSCKNPPDVSVADALLTLGQALVPYSISIRWETYE